MGCSICGEDGHNRATCPQRHQSYIPALWEKIVVVAVAALFLLLVGWLVIRNEPFADPNLVVILRIIISLAVAILGAGIPGFLHVGWTGTRGYIRAAGALALFVLTFLLSPTVVKRMQIVIILADPQNMGSTTIVYDRNDPNSSDRDAIEDIAEILSEDRKNVVQFRVTLKPGRGKGWFKAIHLNKATKTEHLVTYHVTTSGLAKTEVEKLEIP